MSFSKEEMFDRAFDLFPDFSLVAYGIGIPVDAPNFLRNRNLTLFSDNGFIDPGCASEKADPFSFGVGRILLLEKKTSCYTDAETAFKITQSGRLSGCILGAMQVASNGDIASFGIPGATIKGFGGAPDLLSGAKEVVIMMRHTSKNGDPKMVAKCSLPLSARSVANWIITEAGLFKIRKDNLFEIVEKAPNVPENYLISGFESRDILCSF